MKEAVIMTREEYKGFYDSFQALKDKLEDSRLDNMVLRDMLACAEQRINNLWNQLNRPAIEAADKVNKDEFLAWCEKVSRKYEELDEQEWMLDRARFYNNGMCQYAAEHGLERTCEEVERYRKYEEWDTAVPLKNENPEATEGWSEIAYRFGSSSCVLPHAKHDIFDRYFKKSIGWTSERYRRCYKTFEKMEKDCGSWDEFCK